MGLRDWLKPRIQDWTMGLMDNLRPTTLEEAAGDVLEVGFGTGLNLEHYPRAVRGVWGVDPMQTTGVGKVNARIEQTDFPVERFTLKADGGLPFDAGRFDCVVTTWTLCSIPDANAALSEMRRVLKLGGRYLFIEHGRSPSESTAKWQDRINPIWRAVADGCNINRPITELVEDGGFEITAMHAFQGKGPRVASYLYQGVGVRN